MLLFHAVGYGGASQQNSQGWLLGLSKVGVCLQSDCGAKGHLVILCAALTVLRSLENWALEGSYATEIQQPSFSLGNSKFCSLDIFPFSVCYLYLVSFHSWSYVSLLEACVFILGKVTFSLHFSKALRWPHLSLCIWIHLPYLHSSAVSESYGCTVRNYLASLISSLKNVWVFSSCSIQPLGKHPYFLYSQTSKDWWTTSTFFCLSTFWMGSTESSACREDMGFCTYSMNTANCTPSGVFLPQKNERGPKTVLNGVQK